MKAGAGFRYCRGERIHHAQGPDASTAGGAFYRLHPQTRQGACPLRADAAPLMSGVDVSKIEQRRECTVVYTPPAHHRWFCKGQTPFAVDATTDGANTNRAKKRWPWQYRKPTRQWNTYVMPSVVWKLRENCPIANPGAPNAKRRPSGWCWLGKMARPTDQRKEQGSAPAARPLAGAIGALNSFSIRAAGGACNWLRAFERCGKGCKRRAGLNFGDCLFLRPRKARGARLLFKGDDFVHTDIVRT
jgi:hypothetical protein